MLVIGEKYIFNKYDLVKLNKKFKNIEFLSEDNFKEKIEQNINKTGKIVLNFKLDEKEKNDLIKLSSKIISLENFMSTYLNKLYIPNNDTNIKFDYIENIKPFTKFQYFQKRVIDYIGVIVLFIISWPIMIYSRFRIKKESNGSSIYKQNRVGINGISFKCSKFRSMHTNSHHDPYTKKNDSRIFPYGEIMRKTRIDEIPQILNVLKGEMHFIGPRAEWEILVQNYEKEIPYYHKRHLIRPGITGWAQVNYPYGENSEDARQKLMYDLYYIKNWSIWLEIKVIYKTIMVILKREGL